MLPVVSLFTGAGGLDIGIRSAGQGQFDFRAWVEVDQDCRSTLQANNAEIRSNPALFGDIETVEPEALMKAARLSEGETFLLIGGPPCQAFSTAGLRGAVKANQGRVVHRYFSMVERLRPRFFLMENVRGMLSAALTHRPLSDRSHPKEVPDNEDARLGSVMAKVVLPAFARLGYEVVYGILCAADYGSAQTRHRLIVLGSRNHEFRSAVFRKQTSRRMQSLDLVPATHHRFAPYPPLSPWRTLRDAIGDLSEKSLLSEDSYGYSEERTAVFSRIPAGKNWKWIRDNPGLFEAGYLEKVMGGAINAGGGKEGFWRRLSWDEPAPTLTAQPQQLASSLCHPDHLRPLSIPEYAAIQDFPDGYEFLGTKSSRYRQIGNAVPLRLAKAVGLAILAVSRSCPHDRPTRPHPRKAERQPRQPSSGGRSLCPEPVRQRDLFTVPLDGAER